MIFSENTLNVLKSFSSINSGILFRSGNVVRSISPQKTVLATAKVDNSFEKEFAIYDLSRFLSAISLFDKPEVNLHSDHLTISSGKTKLKYVYADPATIMSAPTADLPFPNSEVSFTLTSSDLASVLRGGAVLQMPEIVVTGDGTDIILSATNTKNPTVDDFNIAVGSTDKIFKAVFRCENLKLIPQDYTVSISSKRISKFEGKDLTYFIALEKESSFS